MERQRSSTVVPGFMVLLILILNALLARYPNCRDYVHTPCVSHLLGRIIKTGYLVVHMEWKKFIISWVLGSVLLYSTLFLASAITMAIAPFNIFDVGGMRTATDPVMMFYYLYPVILSLITTFVFSVVRGALQGSYVEKGLMFGLLMFLLLTVTSGFIIITTMQYPVGFSINMILNGLISYPLLGILYTFIWERCPYCAPPRDPA
jgi:hypothetical protein